MISNEPRIHYLEIYQELNKSLDVAKKLVKPFLPLETEFRNLTKEITEIRKELHKIFSHPLCYQICNECHKRSQGGCCKRRDSYLSWGDGIYMASENLEFYLPYPDVEFLMSFESPPCLFLNLQGCLLKEKRPITCLKAICGSLRLEEQGLVNNGLLFKGRVANLLHNLDAKTVAFFNHIWRKNNLCSIDNPCGKHLASCLRLKN